MEILVSFIAVVCTIIQNSQQVQAAFAYDRTSEPLIVGGRIRGVRDRVEKDFVLGGLFPIHSDSEGKCGKVRQERGLERMEAMLLAIDQINADPSLLPGIQLGYDIRDTCNSETVGLDETIDLLVSGGQLALETCVDMVGNGTGTAPTLAVVGAASSRVSVPVAGLTRLFRVPQVSYASSSALLSDRNRYEYFYRTISPDDLQARVMVDVLLHYNWSYVSIIFSQDTYGQPGIEEFKKEAIERGICVDKEMGIPPEFSGSEYDDLVEELRGSSAGVVVVFANQETVSEILTRINASPARRRFLWIASDAWARSIELVHHFNDTAAGLLGVAPLTEKVEQFQEYFSQLTIDSNIRNHWFPEFFAAYAGCNLDVDCRNSSNVTSISRYQQGTFIPLVIDATYSIAHALHNFLLDNCEATDTAPFMWFSNNNTCLGQSRSLDGTALLDYLRNVNFTSPTGNLILFNDFGNVNSTYEILNYQAKKSASGELSYEFQSVGTWGSVNMAKGNALYLSGLEFQFGLEENGSIKTRPPPSHCGRCQPGEYIRPIQGSCCSLCEKCLGKNFSEHYRASECSSCEMNGEMWGNDPFLGSTSCVAVPVVHIKYSDIWAIPSLILACAGIIAVAATSVIFGIFWKTPVVKSSGREQMVLLLVGILCSYILAFFYLAPPSIPICLLQRIGIWFCYSLMFGALAVKVVRVSRIFYAVKRKILQRPRFVEPGYQVLFTCLIVAGQMVIKLMSLIVTHPNTVRTYRYDQDSELRLGLPEVVITCANEHVGLTVLSLLYESVLIVVSTVLGVLSFKFPANFNEAKYISFCTFALLIIWTGLFPAYFATLSQQEYQNAAVSLFVILSAFAMLIILFGPKLFIMLFQPNKNVQFTTKHTQNNLSGIPTGSAEQSMHVQGMKTFIYCNHIYIYIEREGSNCPHRCCRLCISITCSSIYST